MEGSGVLLFNSPKLKSPCSANLSSNNNPFDDIWRKTIDVVSMSERVNRRSSFRLSTDFITLGRKSLSFCDLDASDFGRESMGILPPDFGKDSLDFMNVSGAETHCESLGLIQRNAFRESVSFTRESLGILNLQDLCRESLECGKESLGILQLKSPDIRFRDEGKQIPDILLTITEDGNEEPSNSLNTAFLQTHSRKSSALSSISSINPSFNSVSLEGPSRIYSSSLKNGGDTDSNMLNYNNLIYSTSSAMSSIHSPLNKAKLFSPSELNLRSRIQSVPVKFSPLFEKLEIEDIHEKKCWSTGGTTHVETIQRRSFQGVLDFNEADLSSDFHDSVFIEGHILADKIADGSILNETSGGEVGMLDCTPQPDWPNDLSYNDPKESECQKCDTETIFKTVDKMLPPSTQDKLNIKLKTSRNESNSSTENDNKINTSNENDRKQLHISEQNSSSFSAENDKINKSEENDNKQLHTSEQNTSKLLQNISDIQHEPKKRSFGKGPKEIIDNLSELLNCTNVSDKQKSQGRTLLNSLADILCEGKSNDAQNNLDDSGRSSINESSESPTKQSQECFEVLNLQIKDGNENSCDKTDALGLCLKVKPIENLVNARLSQSWCSSKPNDKFTTQTKRRNASSSSLDKNRTTNSSVASNDSKNSSNLTKSQISGKLRQKHISNLKRGPMKAIIPVVEMKKKSEVPVTPEKNDHKVSTLQSKKTSTPINEPKLKPMAASTPTSRLSGESPRLSGESPRSSKEPRNNTDCIIKSKTINMSGSFTRERANSSTSLPRLSTTGVNSKLRRNSVSDVKKSNEIKRRSSFASEKGIMSSVARAKQNVIAANASNSQSQKQNTGFEGKLLPDNKFKIGECGSAATSSNLEIKTKAATKVVPPKQKPTKSTTDYSKAIPSSQLRTKILSSPSQMKNKSQLHQERRSFCNSTKETGKKEEKETKMNVSKRNSIGNESGMMRSFAKIRQNLLESPYFHENKEESRNKNYIGLSDSNKGLQRDITQPRKSRKTGKENVPK